MSENPEQKDFFRMTKFPVWEPGRRIVASVPAPEKGEWVLIMAIYGILFGLMAGYALYLGFGDFVEGATMSFFEAFIVCAIPLSMVGALHLAGGDTMAGTMELDWTSERLNVQSQFSTKRYSISDIETLVVRGEYQTRGDNTTEARKERLFHARLDACIDDRYILLFTTDSRDLDEDTAIEKIAPIANEVAKSLGVHVVRRESVRLRHRKFLSAIVSAPLWMHAIFLALTLVSTTWVAWRANAFA